MFSISDTPNFLSAQPQHAGNIAGILPHRKGELKIKVVMVFSLSCLLLCQKELEADSSLSLPQSRDKVPASLLLPTAERDQMEST